MRKLWLCLLLTAALILGGCEWREEDPPADNAAEDVTEEAVTDDAAGTDAAETAEPEDVPWVGEGLSAAGLVFMENPTTEVLEGYADLCTCTVGQGGQRLLLRCERELPSLRVVTTEMTNDGGEVGFLPGEELCVMAPFTPEQPLLLNFLPAGDLFSGCGLVCVDPADGETEHFFVFVPTGRGEPGDPPLIFQQIY
ncbi:MAG: hypothetical protein IK116_05335 [Firmicutes bacterium]|nr:hypothetical protein [Bacillota bacterium]